jgi:HIP---CoA ligase
VSSARDDDQLFTIPGALRDAVVRFGTREAVVSGTTRWTYSDLYEHSMHVARALIASGISPGDRVALWAPNSAEWISASFGVYLCGATLVPLNTRFRAEESAHVLRTSGARLLITVTDFLDGDYVAMLRGVEDLPVTETVVLNGNAPHETVSPDKITPWATFLDRAATVDDTIVEARVAAITSDDTSDIVFTSGTTGAPKGAMLTHGASVRTYLAWSELVDLRQTDRYLVVYPFFHTAGLKAGILACVLRGATIYPLAVFDVPVMLELVAAEAITVLPGPPTVFQSILNHPDRGRWDLSSVRAAITGAAVVPVEVIRQMRDVLGITTIITGYGMTETTGTISMCRHDDPPEAIALTVGKPIPGVEVRVVDADGIDVPNGERGEFVVRGYNIVRGYYNDPAGTAAAIDADGWLSTGDIGYIDDQGNLRITDRAKDMFIVGGFNAYPAEIEAMLLTRDDVAQVAVIGVPDERLGEVGVAFVIPVAGTSPSPAEIISWSREHMANYKVPRQVHVVSEFPLTPSGKVMKFELRASVAVAGKLL